ncbi:MULTISPECIES: hypothetical protein [unclassified Sphingomonas]|uniref:hypothetical protein n=1 Tax=unclassified Sphingomonas TaxID=196159 RepID=UPI000A5BF6C9|nr:MULTISPECIES: hypothetical protein [unclassified Sphingomonas]
MVSGRRTNLDGRSSPLGAAERVQWSAAMRATFLDHLAATCNVSAAAEAARVCKTSVYQIRRRDADFAAQWEEALALGYQMVETRLIGHVLAGLTRVDRMDERGDAPAIDFEAALKLLSQHRNATAKPHKGRKPTFAAPDDTDRVLLERLRVIEARRARAPVQLIHQAATAEAVSDGE